MHSTGLPSQVQLQALGFRTVLVHSAQDAQMQLRLAAARRRNGVETAAAAGSEHPPIFAVDAVLLGWNSDVPLENGAMCCGAAQYLVQGAV